MGTLARRPLVVAVAILLVVLAAAIGLVATGGSDAAQAGGSLTSYPGAPGLRISGAGAGWSFHDGENVVVSMGPNRIFTPHLRIVILECADPGGTSARLPVAFASCDENTIQGDSVIVNPDGSFTERAYTLSRLPSASLGEAPTGSPLCDRTHACVLYVGENQLDFTQPKVFSHAFVVRSNPGGSS